MKNILSICLTLLIAGALSAKTTVNKSIHIGEGERHSGGLSSVNGSITIDEGAHISGSCKTVNGSIRVAEECRIRNLQSVNGSIRVAEEVEIESDIETVNGSINCDEGVQINGDVQTVNGSIKLKNTHVDKGISTYNGSVTLTERTVVRKDIIVKDATGHNNRRDPLKIIVDNSTVEGDIINREEDIEVIVYLRNGGRVNGEIVDAIVEKE